MNSSPFISVVVPCYNQASYLNDALQSVLEQSYTNWECIIVNDGSPDNTEEIALLWLEKDKRFKYIKKQNEGVSIARNRGIEIADGEWILPLDGDDIVAKDYLKLASEVMINNPNVGIIYCKAELFGAKEGCWDLPEFDIKTFLTRNLIFNCGFFKKSDWKQVGGYDERMVSGREDWEFWINLIKVSKKEVVRLDYLGFFYRIKETSRNVDFIKNELNIRDTELQIFEKHKDLYYKHFGSIIKVLSENQRLTKENRELYEKLNHIENLFIYKVFKKISNLLGLK